jgi:hypothetical protein
MTGSENPWSKPFALSFLVVSLLGCDVPVGRPFRSKQLTMPTKPKARV